MTDTPTTEETTEVAVDQETANRIAAIAEANDRLTTAERELQEAVDAAREAGLSWAKIGPIFGVSRQAVWERFSGAAKGRKTKTDETAGTA